MAGKAIDYDGMIEVYNVINKTRALTKEELDRVEQLIKRKNKAEVDRAYRQRNKDKIAKYAKDYYKTPNGKKNRGKARMRYYHKDVATSRDKSKEWRDANPDKVAAYKDTKGKRTMCLEAYAMEHLEAQERLHHVKFIHENPDKTFIEARQQLSAATFQYQRGVSMVNRGIIVQVEWYKPDGKLHKKWAKKKA